MVIKVNCKPATLLFVMNKITNRSKKAGEIVKVIPREAILVRLCELNLISELLLLDSVLSILVTEDGIIEC